MTAATDAAEAKALIYLSKRIMGIGRDRAQLQRQTQHDFTDKNKGGDQLSNGR